MTPNDPYKPSPCPYCHQMRPPLQSANWMLIAQTPQSVWDEYRANGYTIAEAIREELSYA